MNSISARYAGPTLSALLAVVVAACSNATVTEEDQGKVDQAATGGAVGGGLWIAPEPAAAAALVKQAAGRSYMVTASDNGCYVQVSGSVVYDHMVSWTEPKPPPFKPQTFACNAVCKFSSLTVTSNATNGTPNNAGVPGGFEPAGYCMAVVGNAAARQSLQDQLAKQGPPVPGPNGSDGQTVGKVTITLVDDRNISEEIEAACEADADLLAAAQRICSGTQNAQIPFVVQGTDLIPAIPAQPPTPGAT